MSNPLFTALALCALPCLIACDGQQYVSPDTVALSITKDATGIKKLNHCNYVPVLLGGEVDATYDVDGDLQAVLSITRDSVKVAFVGAGSEVEPFVATTKDVLDAPQTASSPPAGYTALLSSGCTPDERAESSGVRRAQAIAHARRRDQ